MPDFIEIVGLRIKGYHGTLPVERLEGQEFVIDARVEYDLPRAAQSDDLADAIDYSQLTAKLAEIAGGDAMFLIETLATRLAEECLLFAPAAQAVEITVHKPQAPLNFPVDDVRAFVRRERVEPA